MEELLKELLSYLEDGAPKNETDDKGSFKSLISEKEVEYWRHTHEEFYDLFRKVIIPNRSSLMSRKDLTPKQQAHYMLYLSIVADLAKNISLLNSINTLGLESLEDLHKEGLSYASIMRFL